ncbi:uncharacterized protein DUF2752 [Albibacterium bauzanense]|uniref:Uncharacterized protein DUF2752 n=2 Tax=Albibacterium bauzanense TaxID=653929 RepID=A0A4R1M052_9SPHI|nr:uncharacterized protein DUF2752 [Albibacterium bauzanense]
MILSRNKLYSIMFIACIAGYTWLYFVLSNERSESKQVQVCLIKQFTNIPCPSCGSTRSIILLTKGNFLQALNMNPMGVIIAFIMLLSPIWIIADLITRKKTFFDFYLKIESYLKRPRYAIPLILLVIINWIWNIAKGL